VWWISPIQRWVYEQHPLPRSPTGAPVIGTTGLSPKQTGGSEPVLPRRPGFAPPSFRIFSGAWCCSSRPGRRRRPASYELRRTHRACTTTAKADAPSGHLPQDRRMIEEIRQKLQLPPRWEEHERWRGCRGGQRESGLRLHSSGLPGLVAHTPWSEFGAAGETYVAAHDTIDRSAYMPGVLLTVRRVRQAHGLVYGLERTASGRHADPAQKTAELQSLIPAVWPPGPQFNFCSGKPPQDPQGGLLISVIGGVCCFVLIAQSRIAMRLRGRFWLVCGFVFLLYILLGGRSRSGRRNATLPGTKRGDLRRGGGRPVHAGAHRGAQGTGRWRGRLELVETAAPGSASSSKRGGLPGPRCVSPHETRSTRTIRKGGDPLLVLSERPESHGSGPSATPGFLAWKLWRRGSTRFCCGQPLRELASAALRLKFPFTSVYESENKCVTITHTKRVTMTQVTLIAPTTDRAPIRGATSRWKKAVPSTLLHEPRMGKWWHLRAAGASTRAEKLNGPAMAMLASSPCWPPNSLSVGEPSPAGLLGHRLKTG